MLRAVTQPKYIRSAVGPSYRLGAFLPLAQFKKNQRARRYIIVYCILAPGPGRRPQLKHFVGSAAFGPIVALRRY